ncbi:MAG TPA: hypothetical protein VNN73_17565 [Blastocatellia bacterium]|nr:hypothetical protein [Blastocatellia bacterium]
MSVDRLIKLLSEIPHLFIALFLFFVLLATWIIIRDRELWGLVNTVFGTVIGFLIGRYATRPTEGGER